MAGSLSDYSESGIIMHFFRAGTFAKPAALAVALATGTIDESFVGNLAGKEVASAGGYGRVYLQPNDSNWAAITQVGGTSGTTSNSVVITFPTATANWGTVTDVAILDTGAYGSGNHLWSAPLTTSKSVTSGDTFSFAVGNLQAFIS